MEEKGKESSQLNLNTMLGDYRILKKQAHKWFGTTYVAEHKFLKKAFLLQVFHSEFYSNKGFLERFHKEGAHFSRLSHPHLDKIHALSFADGFYFLVSDFSSKALPLSQYIKERKERLLEEEIYHILCQVGEGIDYLHKEKLFYGTLRGQSILIEEGKKVVLGETLLAKIVSDELLLSKMPAEDLVEHFAFQAPEQKGKKTSFASDIYAFGVLMYWLFKNHYPEGYFEPLVALKHPWNTWLKECLAYPEERRVKALMPLLKEGEAKQRVLEENQREEPIFALKEVEQPALVGAGGFPSIPAPKENPVHFMFNRDPMVTKYEPEKKEIKTILPIPTEMKKIEGGEFFRGSDKGNRDELPYHKIILDSFSIDIHPVTNEQFLRFLEHMGGEKDENYNDLIRLKDSRINRAALKLTIESGYANHPVVGVTWYGASRYAAWIGKRLPSEAEFEVAMRGGSQKLFPTGDTIEKNEANFFSSDTTPVKSYPPNGYGLYDMVGNVYEWCQDWYSYNYYEASALEPNNPKGPLQGVYRVLRGGCWKSLKEDLRSNHRHRNNPQAMNGTYGFRCAK